MKKIVFCVPRLLVFGIFFIYVIIALLSYFDYFEPYLYPLKFFMGEVEVVNERVLIGPYPHYREMKRLKKRYGVSILVSLLNPKLPQERALLNREKKEAKKLGLKVYSFPLGYFNLNSRENLLRVRELKKFLEKHPSEVIYIHCYLGRHRTGFVKKHILTP